jgi:hypothetical protein
MIVKVVNDHGEDRFLTEAAFLKWCDGDEEDHVILEVHIIATEAKTAGSASLTQTRIEEEPSLRLKIWHGDRVFIMNDQGKTIDSKRVVLGDEPDSQS